MFDPEIQMMEKDGGVGLPSTTHPSHKEIHRPNQRRPEEKTYAEITNPFEMAADNSHSVRSHSVHQDDDLAKLRGDRAALSSSHGKT